MQTEKSLQPGSARGNPSHEKSPQPGSARGNPSHEKSSAKAWLIYDGECPLCRRYALHLDVQRTLGELVLVNAREGGPLVEEAGALPCDLNEGMVLKMRGRFFCGTEALHALALLADSRKPFGALNRLLFRSRTASRLAYPVLKLGRRALLKIKGAPMIDSAAKGHRTP